MRIPPVMRKAGSVRPKSSKMSLPATQKTATTTKAVRTDLRATALFCGSSKFPARPTNMGVFANGFIMAKKPKNVLSMSTGKLSSIKSSGFTYGPRAAVAAFSRSGAVSYRYLKYYHKR